MEPPKYFRFYWFTLRIITALVRTALAIHQFSEVDWTKTALNDVFVSYHFEAGEMIEL